MTRVMILLPLFLSFFPPRSAIGHTAPAVVFSHGRVSIAAHNVLLESLLHEVARHASFTVTISPVFTTLRVTVELSNVEIEPAVREILRRAGIANAAWAYRR